MQDPNEDTQWNDVLREKGIIPPKQKEITEDEIVELLESTVKDKTKGEKKIEDKTLDELDELEDEEDEYILLKYRQERIAQLKALASKAKYGDVLEISANDYVNEVNKAGEGVWVVLHLYKQGIPLCALINQHLSILANKFKATKFIKSISNTCIPNYPDRNLPTIFIYYEGEMVDKFVGPSSFRNQLTSEELEWMLGEKGAVPTEIVEDPRPKVRDELFSRLGHDNTDDW